MRVVLDTNVLISGFLYPKSIPGKILQAWQLSQFELIVSESILEETKRVLQYKKISKRFRALGIMTEAVDNFLILLNFFSSFVNITKTIQVKLKRDPVDEHILLAHHAGQANYLVTGDQDLLSLKQPEYCVMTPQMFWEYHLH